MSRDLRWFCWFSAAITPAKRSAKTLPCEEGHDFVESGGWQWPVSWNRVENGDLAGREGRESRPGAIRGVALSMARAEVVRRQVVALARG